MNLRSLIVPVCGLALALLAGSARAGVAVGITVPVAPAVPVYAAAVPVYAAPVVVAPPPVVVAPVPVAIARPYVAPYYPVVPVVTVRAGYWPRGVVVVR